MALPAAINCKVIITATSILGNSVTSNFNSVINLNFDYYKGTVNIVDAVQGDFFFALKPVTTVTYTILGTTTTVTIS